MFLEDPMPEALHLLFLLHEISSAFHCDCLPLFGDCLFLIFQVSAEISTLENLPPTAHTISKIGSPIIILLRVYFP